MRISGKGILWLILLISVLYSTLITYLKWNELLVNEILGKSIVVLIIPFILSLIKGLFDFVRKRFSWNVVKKTFIILWSFFMVISIVSSQQNGLFKKKNNIEQLEKLVKKYVSNINYHKREYHSKLAVLGVTDFTVIEDVKNIDLLKEIKRNINRQKEIEVWNYQYSLNLYENWLDILNKHLNKNDTYETKKIVELLQQSFNNNIKSFDTLRQIQMDYYEKYNLYIDFLIDRNSLITIDNDKLQFIDNTALYEFNQLQSDFYKSSELHLGFVYRWIDEKSKKMYEINKDYFNIKEIDTLINMIKYNQYE